VPLTEPSVGTPPGYARPLVSVLVTAFNLARFLGQALDSALEQSLSSEQIEIIVVDDGSTDETPEVLASYGERVHVIRQENRGVDMAVDRGLQEVTGEFIALLDADDAWPIDKLAQQVEFLQANPSVGLVHGDMTIIDAHGDVLKDSFFEDHGIDPVRGRILGHLLRGNFISGGALMFRGELLPAVLPIPPEVAYHDWTISACIAAVAEIEHLPGTFNLYRFHGKNRGLWGGKDNHAKTMRGELLWRRWMFCHMSEDPSVSSAQLRVAWDVWERCLRAAAADRACSVCDLVPVSDEQRQLARQLASTAAQALRADDHDTAARLLMRALGENPLDGNARADLMLLVRAEKRPATIDPPLVLQLSGRSDFTLAFADELLGSAELLRRYALSAMSEAQTLVVLDASSSQSTELSALAGEYRPDGQAPIEILPVTARTTPARRLLAARARSVLSGQSPPEYAHLPLHQCLATTEADATSSHDRLSTQIG
jgi:glycosyltransferase involved in cell wall biosynthesis